LRHQELFSKIGGHICEKLFQLLRQNGANVQSHLFEGNHSGDYTALKALDSKDDIFEFPPVKEKGLWERRILLFSAHSR